MATELGAIMRRILASLALVLVASAAWGEKVLLRDATFQRSVLAGQELRVFTYAHWHRDCSPELPPQIVLRTLPAHGTASLRPGPSTVAFIREGQPDCTGRTYQGLGVWYVPAPGFRGVDTFDWDVLDVRGTSHDTAVVEVK
jgi:hypothetical protein